MPIDDALPVLPSGEPPPGRFEPDDEWPGLGRWRGPLAWLTRHGSGTLEWSLGRPVRAIGAVLADGSSAGHVETLSPVDRDTWRRPDPAGPGFQLVRLSVEADALVFAPIPRPPPSAGEPDPDDAADMWSDLAGEPAFGAALADRAVADAVYDAFRGTDYRRGEEPAVFSMSYREAGARLADLRGPARPTRIGSIGRPPRRRPWPHGSATSFPPRDGTRSDSPRPRTSARWRPPSPGPTGRGHRLPSPTGRPKLVVGPLRG